MATNLRVGGTHGYQPYREIEPVPPYPRVDPQQPKNQYPRQQSERRSDKDDHTRRRFRAMRKLIDELREFSGVTRVDYLTTETELKDLGLAIAEEELVEQLLQLKVSLSDLEELLQQIRQGTVSPVLGSGDILSDTNNFFPVLVAGLSEYNLLFQNLQLRSDHKPEYIIKQIENEGQFTAEKNRLRLNFYNPKPPAEVATLQLDISILVAVSEVDEAGRRVILYQRADESYALYADKQIDLSI
jgi:hypothetical protein